MRRITTALVVLVALLSFAAVSALAASQTVKGKGEIKKMVVDNGAKAVIVKISGLPGKCEARSLNIDILWSTKPSYRVEAGCYPGGTWLAYLYYRANRSGQEGTKVSCRGFSLKFAAGVWKATVPRSCLKKAANKIKVHAEGVGTSPMPGEAGPTKLLARG